MCKPHQQQQQQQQPSPVPSFVPVPSSPSNSSEIKSKFLQRLNAYSLVQALPAVVQRSLTQNPSVDALVSKVDRLACSGLTLTESTARRVYSFTEPYVHSVQQTASVKATETLAYVGKSVDGLFPETEDAKEAAEQKEPTMSATSTAFRLGQRVLYGSARRAYTFGNSVATQVSAVVEDKTGVNVGEKVHAVTGTVSFYTQQTREKATQAYSHLSSVATSLQSSALDRIGAVQQQLVGVRSMTLADLGAVSKTKSAEWYAFAQFQANSVYQSLSSWATLHVAGLTSATGGWSSTKVTKVE